MVTATQWDAGSAVSAARALLQRGMAPIPVPYRKKKPIIEGWQELKLAESELSEHFSQASNIGVLCGEPSNGLVDVDCDTPEAVAAAAEILPATLTHGRPGNPRSHWWFVAERASTHRYKDAGGETLVELRSTGVQTIVPPSVHPDGERYQWYDHREPVSMDPVVLNRLVKLIAATAMLVRHYPAKGSRDDLAMALAGMLLTAGWDVDAVDEFTERVARLAGDEEAHARRKGARTAETIRAGEPVTGATRLSELLTGDGAKVVQLLRPWLGIHGGDEPSSAPDPQEDAAIRDQVPAFPLQVLPKPMRDYIGESAKAIGCPPDFLAVPALVAAGVAIGTSRCIEVKRGWREYARIWAAIVALTGEKKSPALVAALKPLDERQRQLAHQWEHEYAEWEQSGEGRSPNAPRLQQVKTTDATIEALGDVLKSSSRGVLMARDELSGWVHSLNQYKNGKGADRENWLSLWNGASLLVNRRGRAKPLVIESPFCGVVGAIPPAILEDLNDERGREDGFIHRILFTWPDSIRHTWSDDVVDDATANGYSALFARLWDLKPDDDGPIVLHFTEAARDAWIEFYNDLNAEMRQIEFPRALRGPWQKLEGYAARLALIIHLCRQASGEHGDDGMPLSDDVDEKSMFAACSLIEYFQGHARRVYRHLIATPEDQQCGQVLDWMRRASVREFTAREISRAHVAGVRKAEDAEQVMDLLVARGYGQKITDSTHRGKPTVKFVLFVTIDN